MPATKRSQPLYRVGDWVSFHFGSQNVWAQILEDRGGLGVKGRRLYRIRLDWDAPEPLAFEMPEDDLHPINQTSPETIIEYLKRGGLVEILRSNLSGGKSHPRVWLSFTSEGTLTHAFASERGIVGGSKVPFFALQESKVFKPKMEEVIGLMESFGLSRSEAEDVLRFVGTTS